MSSSTIQSADTGGPSQDGRSIGILGGTFDPVHLGHIAAATGLRQAANLQQVWLMPNAQPPHRGQPLAPAADRMRMVEIALAGRPGLVASRLEVERAGISYTIDTVRELARRFPGQLFELLLGADAAQQIDSWHESRAVLAEASFVIFTRPGVSLSQARIDALGFDPRRTRTVEVDTPDISARVVRQRLAEGQPVDGLIAAEVGQYIRTRHLYGA